MTVAEIFAVQTILRNAGFYTGRLDGLSGPLTDSAIVSFKRSIGFVATSFLGPLTMAALKGAGHPRPEEPHDPIHESGLPWIREAVHMVGLHESTDNAELRTWLSSDGHTVGDPSQVPWCGDFVETSIRLALPKEVVPSNPYWALNWRSFGNPSAPVFGAVASISRNGGGHVGFLVGQDLSRYYLLAGNQGDKTSVSPIAKSRFVPDSFRWPATYPQSLGYLPTMTSEEASNVKES